jgi:hypothetical protein
MIANTSAIAIAPTRQNVASASAPIERRRDLLSSLTAFIERVAESPRSADDAERYWTTVSRGF